MPYCASTAADSRLAVEPVPNEVSGLVNSVPAEQLVPKTWQLKESDLFCMSVV